MCCLCVFMCTTCVSSNLPQRLEEGVRPLGIGVTGSCGPPCGCWDQVLIITESTLCDIHSLTMTVPQGSVFLFPPSPALPSL